MAALTWKNVAGPDFTAGNALMKTGVALASTGAEGLVTGVEGLATRQDENELANVDQQLAGATIEEAVAMRSAGYNGPGDRNAIMARLNAGVGEVTSRVQGNEDRFNAPLLQQKALLQSQGDVAGMQAIDAQLRGNRNASEFTATDTVADSTNISSISNIFAGPGTDAERQIAAEEAAVGMNLTEEQMLAARNTGYSQQKTDRDRVKSEEEFRNESFIQDFEAGMLNNNRDATVEALKNITGSQKAAYAQRLDTRDDELRSTESEDNFTKYHEDNEGTAGYQDIETVKRKKAIIARMIEDGDTAAQAQLNYEGGRAKYDAKFELDATAQGIVDDQMVTQTAEYDELTAHLASDLSILTQYKDDPKSVSEKLSDETAVLESIGKLSTDDDTQIKTMAKDWMSAGIEVPDDSGNFIPVSAIQMRFAVAAAATKDDNFLYVLGNREVRPDALKSALLDVIDQNDNRAYVDFLQRGYDKRVREKKSILGYEKKELERQSLVNSGKSTRRNVATTSKNSKYSSAGQARTAAATKKAEANRLKLIEESKKKKKNPPTNTVGSKKLLADAGLAAVTAQDFYKLNNSPLQPKQISNIPNLVSDGMKKIQQKSGGLFTAGQRKEMKANLTDLLNQQLAVANKDKIAKNKAASVNAQRLINSYRQP